MSDSSNYDPLTGIDWRTRLSVNNAGQYGFNVYLYPAGSTVTSELFGDPGAPQTLTAQDWNAYERGLLSTALQSFQNIINVKFSFTDQITASTLRLIAGAFPPEQEEGPEDAGLGVFGPPGTGVDAGLGGFNTAADVWSNTAGGPMDVGGIGYVTLIHELGHALGLAHPHDDGGGSTIFPGVTAAHGSLGQFNLNQGIYTMMSYNDGWQTAPQGAPPGNNFGYEFTPMAFDIAVLQQKYGANMSYRTGDDTYVLPGSNGAGTGYSCIWDAGGNDALAYDGNGNAVLDLRPATLQWAPGGGGYVSYVQGIFGGYTIAHGVTIENAFGGAGNDLLQGNDAGDLLDGNGGSNTIIGGLGNDTVVSAGNDLIEPGAGANEVWLGAGTTTVNSTGADTVFAGAGAATVSLNGLNAGLAFGGSGRLTYLNDRGSATVVGGSGQVTAFGGSGRLEAWGADGLLVGGSAGGNILLGGENAATLAGGGNNDVLVAGGAANTLLAASTGNTTLVGGAGRSLFAAGAGSDVVVLENGTDTVFGGSSGETAVFGGSGKALVVGGAGGLFVQAGPGATNVFAGNGPDLFAFVAGYTSGGTEVISGFSVAQDRVELQGYGASAAAQALGSAVVANGSTTIVLSDNTHITFSQVTNLPSSVFV